jgi:hypothetical protein
MTIVREIDVIPNEMKINVHEGGVVTYWYKLNEDVECEFSLISEVGELWKDIFLEYISENNTLIITVTDPTTGFYGEKLLALPYDLTQTLEVIHSLRSSRVKSVEVNIELRKREASIQKHITSLRNIASKKQGRVSNTLHATANSLEWLLENA